MKNINKDDAGIFLISTQKGNLIGYSLNLLLKIQKIESNYNCLEIKILLQCHRNYKGIAETKPFLENAMANFLQIHNAKPFEMDGLIGIAKAKKIIKVLQVSVSKQLKTIKEIKEPKPIKKPRNSTYTIRRDLKKPHGNKGKKRGKETIAKHKEIMTGRVQSPEIVAKRVASMKGYKHSEATKAKMATKAMGHKRNVGKKLSETTKAKIGKTKLGNTNCLGRVLSAETKAKISESNKGRKQTSVTIAKRIATTQKSKQKKLVLQIISLLLQKK